MTRHLLLHLALGLEFNAEAVAHFLTGVQIHHG